MPNERGRIHEHKAPFLKQLSAQAFKVYSFVSLCERRIHGHCLGGFVFKCATHGIRCSSAGGYQTALHCVGSHSINGIFSKMSLYFWEGVPCKLSSLFLLSCNVNKGYWKVKLPTELTYPFEMS